MPTYRRRRGKGWLVKLVVWAALIFVGWQFGMPLVQEFVAAQTNDSTAPTTPEQAATRPCPPPSAASLPGHTGTLIARYQTTKHLITVCRATNGQLFYDGQVKGKRPSASTHISLRARRSGNGFIAHNGVYTYLIADGRIVVTKGDAVLLNEVLKPA